MSDQVEEIRCRLCATYFPETDRFCPNCREPRPDVHEDLLMASRLTGVSYEVLLQRAWAEDGFGRDWQSTGQDRPPAASREPDQPPSLFGRLVEKRDSATVGCLVLFGIILLVAVAAVGILAIRDNFGGDSPTNQANQPNPTPTATPTSTPTPTTGGEGASGGTQAASGGGTPADAVATTPTTLHVLILNPAVPAQFSDGAQIRLVASNLSVFSDDQTAEPSPGFRFIAHQVEICSGSEPMTSSPDDWGLEMPDGVIHQPTEPISLPGLEPIALAENQCDSGWITFEAPVSPDPAYVVLNNPTHERIRFAWPD